MRKNLPHTGSSLKSLSRWAFSAPSRRDLLILFIFVIAVTFQPFFLHGQINTFELGLYLPGIDGVLKGLVPYRDFFYLRGPFELYMPALTMMVFGKNVAVLQAYFYVGNVLTLLIGAMIAKELLQSRCFLYLFVPVLTARTFPRVVFTYWGGLRFTIGFLAVYSAIRYLKTGKVQWIVPAGILTAIGALTSIEIGICALVGIGLSLILRPAFGKDVRQTVFACLWYAGGIAAVLAPYLLYLLSQHALGDYIDVTRSILQNMTTVFIQTEPVPSHFVEVIVAMINPAGKNFRHMTPLYAYFISIVYFYSRIKNRRLSTVEAAVMAVAGYGFVMYVSAFRNLWANAFEMALQPQKVVFFVLLERLLFWVRQHRDDKRWDKAFRIFLVAIVLSSLVYSFDRFKKRFPAVQLLTGRDIHKVKPLAGEQTQRLKIDRLDGVTIPAWQARDFIELQDYLRSHTKADEPVLMFPEMATYYFVSARPWIGRFSMVSMTWLNDRWHREFMSDLQTAAPSYAVIPKEFPAHYPNQYFAVRANKEKFDEVMAYVEKYYQVVASTPSLNIFVRKAD